MYIFLGIWFRSRAYLGTSCREGLRTGKVPNYGPRRRHQTEQNARRALHRQSDDRRILLDGFQLVTVYFYFYKTTSLGDYRSL